ncbi:MAG: hypothetical protein ACXWQO_03990 [Bdellovibrionota bacterium]
MNFSKALLAAALCATATLTAHAAPANSEVVWITAAKAVYTPPSGIFWGSVNVKEADGSKLHIGCQSGPFTPYAVDGRITFSDVTAGKPDAYGRPGPTTGTNVMSRHYANDAQTCEGILQWFAKEINKRNGHAKIRLDGNTEDVFVEDLE